MWSYMVYSKGGSKEKVVIEVSFVFLVEAGEGYKKNGEIFHRVPDSPLPHLWEKFKKETKNDLHTMKRILYDRGPLTLVRWPL